MINRFRLPAAFATFFAIFFLVYLLVDVLVLSSFGRVLVVLETDTASEAKLYWSASNGRSGFAEERGTVSFAYEEGQRTSLRFDVNNATIKYLRLDPAQAPGRYRIYSITLLSFFGPDLVIYPHLAENPWRPGPGVELIRHSDHLEVVSNSDDPYLVLERELAVDNPGFRFGVPLVFSFLAGMVVFRVRSWNFAFWQDLQSKKPSSGENYQALDGLRGLAALFVLADHTGVPYCQGLGMVGVTIFFSLSGFLLTMPFARHGQRVMDSGYLQNYFLRRLRRIVPMYYVILFFTYFFAQRVEDTLRSMLFLQGNTIYWTILQEMHFYLLLLPVLLLNHLLLRDKRWLVILVLLIASYMFNHDYIRTYEVYGMGQVMRLFAGIFLGGMVGCYCYHLEVVKNSGWLKRVCSSNLLVGALFLAVVAIQQLWLLAHAGARLPGTWVLSGNYNYLVALLLFVLVMSDRTLVARLLCSTPLRLVGLVSYSFYLLHPVFVSALKKGALTYLGAPISNLLAFFGALLLTLVASTITYSLIERPFLKMSERETATVAG